MTEPTDLVKVYSADISLFDDPALYESSFGFVSPDRQSKAEKYHRENDKKLSVLSSILLSFALRSEGFDIHPSICTGPHGKPYLKDREFNFNISHSATRAICAVTSPSYEIGCDIEAYTKCDVRVAERVFEKQEQKRLESFSGEDADVLFTRMWTRKESYFKCMGIGISAIGTKQMNGYSFYEYSGFPGYSCSICLKTDDVFDPEFIEVTPEDIRSLF